MPILENDASLTNLLVSAKTIAVVGLSNRPERDSYRVGFYLLRQGYTIIPVNPNIDSVFGIKAVKSLADIRQHVDIVNVFRRVSYVPEIIDAAIIAKPGTVWMQLGVIHHQAAGKASAAGLDVVMDRCIMVEHRRLVLQ